jgi:hypothetical protein
MTDIDVSPAFAAALAQDEKTAQLVERTALAIFTGSGLHAPATSAEEAAWLSLWINSDPGTRIRCRNQARAALAASELLERVAELERAIERANTDLAAYAHDEDGNAWARRDVTARLRKVHDKQIV